MAILWLMPCVYVLEVGITRIGQLGSHEEANCSGGFSCFYVVWSCAGGAASEYVANQKTLASYNASATGPTTLQRSQVKRTVEADAYAEKFICAGIRLEAQTISLHLTCRKRTKDVCDHAKGLNPKPLNLVPEQAASSKKLCGQGFADN
jgi:hypothetical protein